MDKNLTAKDTKEHKGKIKIIAGIGKAIYH
jgi:hypothetical protein